MFVSKESTCFLGRTLELEGKGIALAITLDVGPRIISLKKPGGTNLMFEDTADAICKDCGGIYGKGAKWHIYGGHRMWLSPEDESTYYPDNQPVAYRLTDTGVIVTPPPWKVANVQPELEIRFLQTSGADIVMRMTNLADMPQKLCLWALTVLKSGAKMEAKLPAQDTGYLANRNLVLWPYTSLSDPRLKIKDDKVIVKSSVSATGPLKIGLFNADIETKYTYAGTTFIKQAKGKKGAYPDFFCNVESYTNHLIHEVETLSPILRIAPGKTLEHTERWILK